MILADEPTGNLDSINNRRIIELLGQLAEKGKTVIVVTHDRSIAQNADVRLNMDDGRLRHTETSVTPTPSLAPVQEKRQKEVMPQGGFRSKS